MSQVINSPPNPEVVAAVSELPDSLPPESSETPTTINGTSVEAFAANGLARATDEGKRPTRSESMRSIEPSADSVGQYLKEIGQYPLLNREDEVRLGRLRNEGKAAQARLESETDGLPEETRRELLEKVHAGKQSEKDLWQCNLRLVVSIAKKYSGSGMPLLDLVQEGNIGLSTAVEKFDPERGFKFSTYATWWIRQAITRGIVQKGRNVRLPDHIAQRLETMNRVEYELITDLKRYPTEQELSERLGWPIDKLRDLRQVGRDTVSLDKKFGEGEDSDLTELIEDRKTTHELDIKLGTAAERQIIEQCLDELLNQGSITQVDHDVLLRNYGFVDGSTATIKALAIEYDLPNSRITIILERTRRKLRVALNQKGIYAIKDIHDTSGSYSSDPTSRSA